MCIRDRSCVCLFVCLFVTLVMLVVCYVRLLLVGHVFIWFVACSFVSSFACSLVCLFACLFACLTFAFACLFPGWSVGCVFVGLIG